MQKLKNIILASFLAKLDWDTVRKKKFIPITISTRPVLQHSQKNNK